MLSSLNYIIKEGRIRIYWIITSFILTCFFCFLFSEELLFVLTKPFLQVAKPKSFFICTQLTESLNTTITTSFILSFFFWMPHLIYQLWCFFIPSCKGSQRVQLAKYGNLSAFAFFFVFFLTFVWIMPNIWVFLYNLSNTSTNMLRIQLQPKIYDFIKLTLRFFLLASIFSQLPVLLICFLEYKKISLEDCIKHRKSAVFLSVLFSALVTPPDIWCQLAAWLPIYFILELTLFTALIQLEYAKARKKLTKKR
uniref:SecY-independent transporter protein n=1 Tax=Gonatozygon brebissonii TaxID=184482 RepID=A0A6G9IF25_9VIRI|nr:SecY-independent transporter protein [Gonatozygon brebissonii]QIQ23065.1 SecY-independent transporter protein [Gonatozygon brebissonii]